MNNTGGEAVQRIFVKVFGFDDVERHALNTVFRLSGSRNTAYALWAPGSPEPIAALIDGDSWEAALELANPANDHLKLIWIGDRAPGKASLVMRRPLQWAAVIDGMDRLFASASRLSAALQTAGTEKPLDLDMLSSPQDAHVFADKADAANLHGDFADTTGAAPLYSDFADTADAVTQHSDFEDTVDNLDGADIPAGQPDFADTADHRFDHPAEQTPHHEVQREASIGPGPDRPIALHYTSADTEPGLLSQRSDARDEPDRVLVVDANRDARLYLRARLAMAGFLHVDEAESGAEAIQRVNSHLYKLVILDLEVKDMDGWHLTKVVTESRPTIAHIILTGHSVAGLAKVRGWFAGVKSCMTKPLDPVRLKQLLVQTRNAL